MPNPRTKETEKMELPWQDISEMPFFTEGLGSFVFCRRGVLEFYSDPKLIDLKGVTKFLLLTPPEAKTVEAPVEPVRVSVQEFLNNPEGKWITYNGTTYSKFYQPCGNVGARLDRLEDLVYIGKKDYPIYASDPTAWLASQAEQKGKSE